MTTWLYLIPFAALAVCVWWNHRNAASLRDVLAGNAAETSRQSPGPLDAAAERIVPPRGSQLSPADADLLASLAAEAAAMPHSPFVTRLADDIAGLYSGLFPALSADEITRMLVVSYLAQRRGIAAGATTCDLADATGHAAVVLASRPDVPTWSTQ